ncbi:GAF and ANTAR domain-containing protein [Vallicoccus soli]|uniref:ANTAR domain-containing protein n=1 Tax=Vallicoccus soli TaxID=2339232 RepID=A0A3A3ZLD4_9ACTN|nr:GAF and ANTAR domain-containing protein [Vallicoccus soli]RJK97006.1 ANTAR domain-containing protein [Vallicoccus soli]
MDSRGALGTSTAGTGLGGWGPGGDGHHDGHPGDLAVLLDAGREAPDAPDGAALGEPGGIEQLVAAAVAVVPGVQQASSSRADGSGALRSVAATGVLAAEVDRLQQRLGEGPCLDALRGEPVVAVYDVDAEERWPGFRAGAAELGLGGCLPVRVRAGDEDLGALNVHSPWPGALDGSTLDALLLLVAQASADAAHAGPAAPVLARLPAVLGDHDVVRVAAGVLVQRTGATPGEALLVLTRLSRALARPLPVVAADVVDLAVTRATVAPAVGSRRRS